MKKIHLQLVLPSLLLFVLVISGCSDFAPMVRKVTYPSSFKYVDGSELRSQMKQLAFQIQLLEKALVDKNELQQQTQQQEVLGILTNIEKVGSNLQAGEEGSNHPFLQNFMKDFVTDVAQARIAVSLDTPNYYFAGKVAGGCVNCHEINR